MMFSRNVFWGATRPRRPPGIMGAPLLPSRRPLAIFVRRWCHVGRVGKHRVSYASRSCVYVCDSRRKTTRRRPERYDGRIENARVFRTRAVETAYVRAVCGRLFACDNRLGRMPNVRNPTSDTPKNCTKLSAITIIVSRNPSVAVYVSS